MHVILLVSIVVRRTMASYLRKTLHVGYTSELHSKLFRRTLHVGDMCESHGSYQRTLHVEVPREGRPREELQGDMNISRWTQPSTSLFASLGSHFQNQEMLNRKSISISREIL